MPAVSGRARRLAAHGISIVLIGLVCRLLALLSWPVAVVAVEALLVVGTWLFTLRCDADNRTARALGWVLRLFASIDSGLAMTNSLGLTSWNEFHACLAIFILPTVALAFIAARLHSFGLPQLTRRIVALVATCMGSALLGFATARLAEHLAIVFAILAFTAYLAVWLWGFALMLQLRRSLWVDAHEWWLDVEALPRVEWTSYARLRDGRIEVAGARAGTSWFDNYAGAIFWLSNSGFCAQEQALAEGLVDQAPAASLARS